MGRFEGGFLRLLATFLYFIEFCCAAIGLGIYSYFLAKLHIHHLYIEKKWRAVEGLTGSGVLYTIFAILLTCFLGGIPFFASLAILLNLLFCGAFIAVAILTRNGDHTCTSGIITTPLGIGRAGSVLEPADTHVTFACRLNSAVFATSIVAAVLFFISTLVQLLLLRNHRKENKYGPSPSNGYTSGSAKRKFWQRKQAPVKDVYATNGGAELGTVPGTKASHETAYTGTTHATEQPYGTVYPGPGPTAHGATGNPYGYTNQTNGTAVNY